MTTVVFADLVGSTGIFERMGDAAASRFVTQLTGTLGQIFEQHHGRVVKILGDGLFVVFAAAGDALAACAHIQSYLQEKHILPGDSGQPVQMQIGIESGEVVEIDGDCFGDTVNSAARLADLAGAAQILTTENVWKSLLPLQRRSLRSMGPMFLRGRSEASHVYRVEWDSGREEDATMFSRSMVTPQRVDCLELHYAEHHVTLYSYAGKLSFGRSADVSLTINDPRVSRVHATLEWRGGHFVLTDTSSFGTWVYLGQQTEPVLLRRTECHLVGSGDIVPSCRRTDDNAPVISFSISS